MGELENFLEHLLIRNFTAGTGDIRFRNLYNKYQQATKEQGGNKVLSLIKFFIVVKEVALAQWKTDVGPVTKITLEEKRICLELVPSKDLDLFYDVLYLKGIQQTRFF